MKIIITYGKTINTETESVYLDTNNKINNTVNKYWVVPTMPDSVMCR